MTTTLVGQRTEIHYILPLKELSAKEYLISIKPLFDEAMQKEIDCATTLEDEKLALVGVLLCVIRPNIETKEDLIDVEDEILRRINDSDYIAEMERLESERRMLAAMAKGFRAGVLEGKKNLIQQSKNLGLQMEKGLTELRGVVDLFHDTRRGDIEETRSRIESLSKQEGDLLERTGAILNTSMDASKKLTADEERLAKSLDEVGKLMWKV
jgi:hypothetical protein